jgi:transcriptional regulator with XRE-family HTH domain
MKYSTVPLPSDTASRLAKRLKGLRKSKKWTQAELARRSGVSLGSLKRFEQQGKISLENLLALAHVLDRLHDFAGVFAYDADRAAAERRFAELNQ